jgi:hypothetical protein
LHTADVCFSNCSCDTKAVIDNTETMNEPGSIPVMFIYRCWNLNFMLFLSVIGCLLWYFFPQPFKDRKAQLTHGLCKTGCWLDLARISSSILVCRLLIYKEGLIDLLQIFGFNITTAGRKANWNESFFIKDFMVKFKIKHIKK